MNIQFKLDHSLELVKRNQLQLGLLDFFPPFSGLTTLESKFFGIFTPVYISRVAHDMCNLGSPIGEGECDFSHIN